VELKGGKTFHWASPFFGLTDEYKIVTYQQIYDLERFTFSELYSMPVYMRNFYFRYASKRQEDQRRADDKARGATEGTPISKKDMAKVPGFVASQASARG
jgi:Asp-tRNA(Asn)/Glu-tRNA(Gln) amidotransferase A subunit family amidase